MDYQLHYDNLIKTRQNRKRCDDVYYERHHIIPKSMGGTNEEENLVYLTAREHFIAHWLLWRIHRNKSMACAFQYMINSLIGKHLYTPSSRSYSEAKEARKIKNSIETRAKISAALLNVKWSEKRKEECRQRRSGIGHHSFGKNLSERNRESISKSLTGKKHDEERRMKKSETSKNRKWYHDDNRSFFIEKTDPKIEIMNLKPGRKCV